MTEVYAGIGSRETPSHILEQMLRIAYRLSEQGYTLRSGGADGADSAFAAGAGVRKEIYRPHHATAEAMELAAQFHPAWHRCSDHAKKLHARNGFQVLGPDLRSPSKFIVCWTKDGKASGGTGRRFGLPRTTASLFSTCTTMQPRSACTPL